MVALKVVLINVKPCFFIEILQSKFNFYTKLMTEISIECIEKIKTHFFNKKSAILYPLFAF